MSQTAQSPARATLYTIPGSHACRTGGLMLEHKGIDYRRVDLLTGAHPFSLRLRGFPGNSAPIRSVNGRTHGALGMMDRLGTVPALRHGSDRVQTNHDIARFLDRIRPDPPLFPEDPERRTAVEEAERWGDQVFQMAARRLALAGALNGLDGMHNRAGKGRLGPLLSTNEKRRVMATRTAARFLFHASLENETQMLRELTPMLDRIDGWVHAGLLNSSALNVADFMIAPSLALLTYRVDLREEIAARPLAALTDRILPEP